MPPILDGGAGLRVTGGGAVMRITEVKAYPLDLKPAVSKIGAIPLAMNTVPVTVVKVMTDEGISGFGAAVFFPSRTLACFIDETLRPRLVGQDPFKLGALTRQIDRELVSFYHGIHKGLAIVETALWDIVGQAVNVPVAKLFGLHADRVAAYASTAVWKSPEAMADDAARCVEDGFKAIKLRVGRPNPRDDLAVVAAVRRAVGDGTVIMVDVNMAWSLPLAVKMAKALAEYDVYFIEEPMDPVDLDGYADLRRRSDVAIAAGENYYRLSHFKDALAREAVDVVQPDYSWAGGVSFGLKVAALAEAYQKPVIPHAGLFLADAVHVGCAVPNCPYVMYSFAMGPVREYLLERPIELRDGYLLLPQEPGMGIKVREKALLSA